MSRLPTDQAHYKAAHSGSIDRKSHFLRRSFKIEGETMAKKNTSALHQNPIVVKDNAGSKTPFMGDLFLEPIYYFGPTPEV